jgi:hypothetical protein
MRQPIPITSIFILAASCATVERTPSPDDTPTPVTKPTALFNGRDFTGWTFNTPPAADGSTPDPAETWSVRDGVIDCTGTPTCYIRTTRAYRDFQLHIEWRWTAAPGNSGVFVHAVGPDKIWPAALELQNLRNKAGDVYLLGGSSVAEYTDKSGPPRMLKQAPVSEKPAGEWNAFDAVCNGDTLTLHVNGVLQNKVTGALPAAGFIGIQSEGAPVEYRNITLTPLN